MTTPKHRVLPPLPFTSPFLLAPMEGVTDPAFRDVVMARHDPLRLGGVFTEFVRITEQAASPGVIQRHLGAARSPIPVGLQLMGSDVTLVAASAATAAARGAAVVDLNFGCPAKGALRGCAGSALLDDPPKVAALVSACVDAVEGRVPVTAKVRAGVDDADRVEEIAGAAEDGGASMLTVHCRTRAERYQDSVDWSRIRRAVEAVSIPVCGNGGVRVTEDIRRMRIETGCAFVMVGRAALGDPWIFSGERVTRQVAARFLLDYASNLRGLRSGTPEGAAARMKQLLRYWTAGGLVTDQDRLSWLREPDPARLMARIEAALGDEVEGP
ncbi:MAG: tRNA-dihydrouridine synthase family protein [Planctomycetota bacterium]|nr:tRNA-dihydrouridine synthase family protein [Planctomycetota bacterium]